MELPEDKLQRAFYLFYIVGLWLAPFCFLGDQWAFGALAYLGTRVIFYLLNYLLIESLEIDFDEWLQNRVSNLRLLWLYALSFCGFFGVIYASGQAWALGVIIMLLLLVLCKVTPVVFLNSDSSEEDWNTLALKEERPLLDARAFLGITCIPFGLYFLFFLSILFSDDGFTRASAILNAVLWAVAFISIYFMIFRNHPRLFSRKKWKILLSLAWVILLGCFVSFLFYTSVRVNTPNYSDENVMNEKSTEETLQEYFARELPIPKEAYEDGGPLDNGYQYRVETRSVDEIIRDAEKEYLRRKALGDAGAK